MKLLKKIIKKLAKLFLSERDIKDLLWKSIFIFPDKLDWQEAEDLFVKIYKENPKLRDYIYLRKSQLLNNSLEEDKNYIQGAIGELLVIENLMMKIEEREKHKEAESIKFSVDKFLNYFKQQRS